MGPRGLSCKRRRPWRSERCELVGAAGASNIGSSTWRDRAGPLPAANPGPTRILSGVLKTLLARVLTRIGARNCAAAAACVRRSHSCLCRVCTRTQPECQLGMGRVGDEMRWDVFSSPSQPTPLEVHRVRRWVDYRRFVWGGVAPVRRISHDGV